MILDLGDVFKLANELEQQKETELESLRAERDRYARALRRVVRRWMQSRANLDSECGHPWRERKLEAQIDYLAAREARGPWKQTHPSRPAAVVKP